MSATNAERQQRRRVRTAGLYARVFIEIDCDEHAELKAEAKRQNTSVTHLVRQYITWGLENDTEAQRCV